MVKKNFLKSSLIIAIVVAMMLPVIPTMSFAVATTGDKPIIKYSAHMQTYAWGDKVDPNSELTGKDAVKNFAGVTGESKRMEALRVNLGTMKDVTLKYRAHVQTFGWQDWVTATPNGNELAGTTGLSKRVEALQLSVEGLTGYRILYRAHVQTYGWTNWVDAADSNAFAGVTGESKRMEAFEIVVVPASDIVYSYKGEDTEAHTITYKGTYMGDGKCSYGEWTAANGNSTTYTQSCALCGHQNADKQVKLQDVLREAQVNGTKEVKTKDLTLLSNETLTVPEGVTLEVNGTLDLTHGAITNNGAIVVEKIKEGNNGNSITNAKGATVTVQGLYDDTADKNVLATHMDGKHNYVTHIVLEEGSVKQEITTNGLTLPATSDLTLDLNGTEVESSVASDVITNQGKLTINEGLFKFTGSSNKGIRTQGKDSILTINNSQIESTSRGISVGQGQGYSSDGVIANITNTEIKVTSSGKGLAIYGDKAVANLNNVDITADEDSSSCLYANGANKDITLNVVGGTLSSAKCIVAYLPAVGSYTFDGTSMTGSNGIEVTGGDLTLKNHSIVKATGATSPLSSTAQNLSDNTGYGVMVKVMNTYAASTDKLNINITNSTITSEHDYALRVAEFSSTKRNTPLNINISHDSSSSLHGGARDYKNFRLSGDGTSQVTITENSVKQSV